MLWWFWRCKDIIEEVRYFNIPLGCRECLFLWDCRKPWYKGHGCRKGCYKMRLARKQQWLQDEADRLDSLVRYTEEQEKNKNRGR